MKTVSIFNNKGGVGKTTLTFHLAYALSELGHKTLIIDLDPQCNLTICSMNEEAIHNIWQQEDPFIDDFERAQGQTTTDQFNRLLDAPRSIHFLLKPTEDGTAELPKLCPPFALSSNLDLIPGRLSMHLYEDKIASRWSDVYQGNPLAIRTVARIRQIANAYAAQYGYEYVIMDTSPSLGVLNKVVISTTDGFIIPCMPDVFSLYGIRNIGKALALWTKQFQTIFQLLSDEKRERFPKSFVSFLGFTIYNARKYSGTNNRWNLALAHYNYAQLIPSKIRDFIDPSLREHLSDQLLAEPVGAMSVMHSHSTLPSMAQKYHLPIWRVPSCPDLEPGDRSTIGGNRHSYESTKENYHTFAIDLMSRLSLLDQR